MGMMDRLDRRCCVWPLGNREWIATNVEKQRIYFSYDKHHSLFFLYSLSIKNGDGDEESYWFICVGCVGLFGF